MKASTLLATPWRVTHPSQSWLMLALFALCTAGAAAIAFFAHDPHWWLGSTMLYCAGIGLFWAVQMPHLLLLSIDARKLRAPGIQQTSAWAVVLYALLCIAVPVLVLAPLGANAAAVALAVALTITAGLAFALLARYALLLAYLLFFAAQGLVHLLHIPLPNHPSHATLAALGITALVVLLVMDISRWRTLARDDSWSQSGFRGPMMMQFARDGTLSLRTGAASRDDRWIRQVPEWLRGRADLRDVDRIHPTRAIRIAIGRRVMPLTRQSRLRQAAVAAGWLVFVAIVVFGEVSPRPDPLFSSAWFWMLAGGFMIIAVPSGWLMAVRQRWSGMNANLSVLALLPGLGTPAEQKRRVLHAALLQPMSWLLGVLLACWIVVVVIHASPAIGAYALLVVVGSGALLCTAVLGSLGGKPLSGFALGALFVVLLVLMGVTPGLDKLPRIFFESGSAVVATRQAVATCWLAWLAVVGVLAVRGWRCLQRRPHPFLANDR